MVDLDRVRPVEAFVVDLTSETLDGLLFDWLDELIGRKDIHALVFGEFQVRVDPVDGRFTLKATVRGQPIGPGAAHAAGRQGADGPRARDGAGERRVDGPRGPGRVLVRLPARSHSATSMAASATKLMHPGIRA